MKNQFAEEFARYSRIKEQYDAANKANDASGKKAAADAMVAFRQSISDKGQTYCDLYEKYEEAMERGNEYIDLSECYEYRDEAALISSFREHGIEKFTFSSGWSSAVESAWLFIQNGCTLVGMVEINSRFTSIDGDGFEKRHAYLFSVN